MNDPDTLVSVRHVRLCVAQSARAGESVDSEMAASRQARAQHYFFRDLRLGFVSWLYGS
jgi:hypothetical protein